MSLEKLPHLDKNQETKSNPLVKKMVLGALAATSLTSYAKESLPDIEDKEPVKEITYQEKSSDTHEKQTANPFKVGDNKGLYESTDPVEKSLGKEEKSFSIDVTKSFGFEKAKLNTQQFKEAEAEIISQLQLLPPQTLIDLEQGKKVILVKVSRSPEEIIKGGYDAGRGWVFNNEDLAKDTADEGSDLIESATKKFGLSQVTLQFEIPQGGVDKENPQRYVKISFEDIIENEPTENSIEIISDPEFERLSQSYAVIIDKSPSMNLETTQVQETINDINKKLNSDIKIVKLEAGTGGATEKHMLTINKVLDGVKEAFGEKKYIYIYTDEPDFDSSKSYLANGKYEIKLQETINRAKELNIEIRLKAYQPGNTLKFVDKVLESGDLTMQTKQSESDNKWFDQLVNHNTIIASNE